MKEFLIANEAIVSSVALYGSILVAVVWETFSPLRRSTEPIWIRWLNNSALWLISITLMHWLVAGVALSASLYAEQFEIGLFRSLSIPEPMAIFLGVLALDYCSALKHRLFHVVPFLWRFHSVHHSDLDCDVSTSLRSHPLDVLLDSILWILIVVIVGAPALALLIFYLMALLHNPFRHANVNMPPDIERLLRFFVITPDLHRVHHSSAEAETNSNYGVIFPWWDWLMQTYCAEPVGGQRKFQIGLEYFRGDSEMWLPRMISQPFRRPTVIESAADNKKPKAIKPGKLVNSH